MIIKGTFNRFMNSLADEGARSLTLCFFIVIEFFFYVLFPFFCMYIMVVKSGVVSRVDCFIVW